MKKLLVLFAVVLSVFAFAACGDSRPVSGDEPDVPAVEEQEIHYYNPLTGIEVDAPIENRVVAVSMDNHPDARPQYGITSADLVYEVPAEGQIPRIIGVFYSHIPEQVGATRSARPYIVDIAREWDALLVHCGGSTDALNYLSRGTVDNMNEISYGSYFWRESSRVAPHNLLTSGTNIYSYLADRGFDTVTEEVRSFSFMPSYELSAGEKIDRIRVKFQWADNIYQYDKNIGCYTRMSDGQLCTDAVTGATVHVANIIVQQVSSRVVDSMGHLSIDMTAGGEAWLFTGGRMVHGSWSREDLDSPTIFVDDDGYEFRLNPGQTWIELADGNVDLEFTNTAEQNGESESEVQ